MRLRVVPVFSTALSLVFLVSCSEDPKLVEKRERQRVEITKLKGDVALVEEKLKNLPPDVSSDLAEARQTAEKQAAEVALLEAEVAKLDARKRALQAEFDSYHAKYQVK